MKIVVIQKNAVFQDLALDRNKKCGFSRPGTGAAPDRRTISYSTGDAPARTQHLPHGNLIATILR
jgi:hypothetical protein